MQVNLAILGQQSITVMFRLTGDVQGAGIRPTVANLAVEYQLSGYVRNCFSGVEINVHGENAKVNRFQISLSRIYPNCCRTHESHDVPKRQSGFQIIESDSEGAAQFIVPLDRVICESCLNETMTPGNRRFGYALNSCAQCGPRYSIITAMPYDRSRTSMQAFAMCVECEAEYRNPSHRRFHAQTNCCPICGPCVWMENEDGRIHKGGDAIELAAQVIKQRGVVAVKGVGGYQLVCDASDKVAVGRLRAMKGRVSKPLAVMIDSLQAAHSLAKLNDCEEAALASPIGPIVVLRARRDAGLAHNIHPGLADVGLMLPTTALHALLLAKSKRPLVVTSGNREGEPLVYDCPDASNRYCEPKSRIIGTDAKPKSAMPANFDLHEFADCVLHHNRPIQRPIDDSVVRCIAGRQVTLRAARGLAPMAIDCQVDGAMLALGGQQKAAIALANGSRVFLGPHIGGLDGVWSRERYKEQLSSLADLVVCKPGRVAWDLHPDYFTSAFAEEILDDAIETVQHHHAHVVSAMVDHNWLDREVLGFAFDGTGYGLDGTVWGGEVLRATADGFQRVGNVRPLSLAGGAAAVESPWRVAMALLSSVMGKQAAMQYVTERLCVAWQVAEHELRAVASILDSPRLAPPTSSMGRLFDGVAAIIGEIAHSGFEGESAMLLESICDLDSTLVCDRPVFRRVEACEVQGVPFRIELDWRPMIKALVRDTQFGVPAGVMAMKFHRWVADSVVQFAEQFPDLPVVLTGGVFQNRVLVELISDMFDARDREHGLPGGIPPNDGGLAIGQLIVADRKFAGRSSCA